MERAISSVNVDDTTNVWNHVRTRNLSIKSTWMPRPRIIIRAIEKYRGGRGGGVGGSCRQYRRCKYLTKIRRRLSSFRAYRRRWGAGNRWDVCEIIFRRARSTTLSEISDEWKALFLFPSFFLPLPLRSPSFFPLVLLPFCFLFPVGRDLGLDPRRVSKNRSPLRVSISRPERYIDVAILIALLFPRVEWRNLDVNK